MAEKAYSEGIVITLTGNDGNATLFTVSYDKDKSWNFGTASWAVTCPPNAELAPILNPDAQSRAKRRKMVSLTA